MHADGKDAVKAEVIFQGSHTTSLQTLCSISDKLTSKMASGGFLGGSLC